MSEIVGSTPTGATTEIMMIVHLDEKEMAMAKNVAAMRNESQRNANRADGLVKGDSLGRDIQGATSELAVSKGLMLPWDGKFVPMDTWDKWKIDGNDVGILEVRSTSLSYGRLILHHTDKDNSPYLLAILMEDSLVRIVGWIYGKDGKQKKYWRDDVPRPCFMVPQKDLIGIERLAKMIHNAG